MNRMSPSAWLRGNESAVFSTPNFLAYLEDIGTPVINGHQAFSYEISKARQITLASQLGIRHPQTRVITAPEDAVAAAEGLAWPVLVKPNMGGSGAGIVSFESRSDLAESADLGKLEFGPDHTALVQEHLPAEDDAIVRVEFLNGEFLYAIRLLLVPGSFNLCPADYCELPGIADGVSGRGLAVEAYQPPDEVIRDAGRLLAATGADLGGVEYLVNERDGQPYFYDVNMLSNFVADAPDVIGFDPFVNLVDFIEEVQTGACRYPVLSETGGKERGRATKPGSCTVSLGFLPQRATGERRNRLVARHPFPPPYAFTLSICTAADSTDSTSAAILGTTPPEGRGRSAPVFRGSRSARAGEVQQRNPDFRSFQTAQNRSLEMSPKSSGRCK